MGVWSMHVSGCEAQQDWINGPYVWGAPHVQADKNKVGADARGPVITTFYPPRQHLWAPPFKKKKTKNLLSSLGMPTCQTLNGGRYMVGEFVTDHNESGQSAFLPRGLFSLQTLYLSTAHRTIRSPSPQNVMEPHDMRQALPVKQWIQTPDVWARIRRTWKYVYVTPLTKV